MDPRIQIVQLRIPVEDHARIKARTRESLRTINQEIVWLVQQALRNEPAPPETKQK